VDNAVKLYAWHFMAWPYLPPDFDERYDSAWVTVPNSLFDPARARGLYQQYIDQLVAADELGFDGMVLNEHHQNVYGLMPAPNLIAAALTQRGTRGRIVVLGNLLPLALRPLRVAEEYAMLDNLSDGRLIAGFAVGAGQEMWNYNLSPSLARERFWEAVDLIDRAWTEDGPFSFEGKHYPLRYVNPWPKPLQQPRPPIWVPGGGSMETVREVARRGYCYFFSSRSRLAQTVQAAQQLGEVLQSEGQAYHPYKMGILLSVHVAETDELARQEAEEGVFYFLHNCLKGHMRRKARNLVQAPGSTSPASYSQMARRWDPTRALLGDCETWEQVDASGSIFVGAPNTVRERLWEYVRDGRVGHLLIQFHMGNMPHETVLKSQALFAREVMPWLRERSAELFGREYPDPDQAARALQLLGA
jgi:alkanesulfonate monooxygenase SsuD/methylene tetrahydromethanopterin reductase-like flavin-dependent oxidoreductase (luciferase family)